LRLPIYIPSESLLAKSLKYVAELRKLSFQELLNQICADGSLDFSVQDSGSAKKLARTMSGKKVLEHFSQDRTSVAPWNSLDIDDPWSDQFKALNSCRDTTSLDCNCGKKSTAPTACWSRGKKMTRTWMRKMEWAGGMTGRRKLARRCREPRPLEPTYHVGNGAKTLDQWGLLTDPGAFSTYRMDVAFATWLECIVGKKTLFFRPRLSERDQRHWEEWLAKRYPEDEKEVTDQVRPAGKPTGGSCRGKGSQSSKSRGETWAKTIFGAEDSSLKYWLKKK
jgi:hypothetical protein